jgi:hypothetical protein
MKKSRWLFVLFVAASLAGGLTFARRYYDERAGTSLRSCESGIPPDTAGDTGEAIQAGDQAMAAAGMVGGTGEAGGLRTTPTAI